MKKTAVVICAVLGFLISFFALPKIGLAADPTVLYSFDGASHGSNPYGSLILSNDGITLYGMTRSGGTNSLGVIFSEPVAGGTPTVLYSFDGTNHGSAPTNGCLTLSNDGTMLYGMTTSGGANNLGVIFSEPVAGGTPTVLYSFDGASHGSNPYGSLILSNDGTTLYGMTRNGGTNSLGVIFSEPVAGGTPTVLFNFDGTHGSRPYGSLILAGSTLFGMTSVGGANNLGVIFSEPVAGGTPTVLFNFDNAHGETPYGSLILSGSTLYGTTIYGGTNNLGVIFSEPVAGGTPTVLYSFDGTNHGAKPYGTLILSGSTFFGTTMFGGTDDHGVIFSEPVAGGTPTVLYSFDGINHGSSPGNSLLLSGPNLYGMTTNGGGINDYGVIFSESVATPLTSIGSTTGTLQVGQTLTAGTLAPAGATATYQWVESTTSGGTYSNIGGAANSTYVLQSSDIGKYIEVVATGSGIYTGSVTGAYVGPIPSNDAALSALTLSSGSLSPTFVSTTTSYTASVSHVASSITVTPTANDAANYHSITVNGASVTSGSASNSIALSVGSNTITIMVTAQDNTATRTYTVTATRADTTPLTSIGSITGILLAGQTLTAGAVSPLGATFDYQWLESSTSTGTYTNISGATSSTYTLQSSDVGKYIKVQATGYGNYSGTATSNPTSIVSSSSTFILSLKPEVNDLKITLSKNGTVNINNLSPDVTQITVSTNPSFDGASWENISNKDELFRQYAEASKLYMKFRNSAGGVSDVVVYDTGADAAPFQTLNEGDIVKTADNFDVYIIKYKNGKQYKRLILSPSVFDSYQHLKWENIKVISQAQMDQYVKSILVKETNDTVIYELTPLGDTGKRKPMNTSGDYDGGSVYEINKVDRDSYILEN